MVDKKLSGAGLRGHVAGNTSICTVNTGGTGLSYRGYSIEDLSSQASFEEVAWLLLKEELPSESELAQFKSELASQRELPRPLLEVLERIPQDAHPMDVMRTGCSVLGNLESEADFSQQWDVTTRLLATMPAMVIYWYRFTHEGTRISTMTDAASSAGHFLELLHGKTAPAHHESCLNCSLILYAEHEFNASTFTARICASTLSDMHSCITGAIGSLRGPLHGGANEAAMDMMRQWHTVEEAQAGLKAMLARKEKVMGFGHAIYRKSDPRNALIKSWAERLAAEVGDTELIGIAQAIEQIMWDEKALFANADFFHAPAYHYMGIPVPLFTPIFAWARTSGWAAHVIEQRTDNRIIRPSAEYQGPEARSWKPMGAR
ncbi:MAG: bifunctional 2-methylcitrate synthase/citrate synthase [Gammaproteobacteria bacterium]